MADRQSKARAAAYRHERPCASIDYRMDKAEALRTQNLAHSNDELIVWTITWGTNDFGDQFIARPHLARAGRYMHRHLIATSLDEIRALLPPGLRRLDPDPNDDPVIVEVWI